MKFLKELQLFKEFLLELPVPYRPEGLTFNYVCIDLISDCFALVLPYYFSLCGHWDLFMYLRCLHYDLYPSGVSS